MPKGYHIPFTAEQQQYIKDHFLDIPVKRLAKQLGCSGGRINRFLKKHDLVIPQELIQKRIQDSRRKKGHVPYNKGMKQSEYMSAEAIERTKATRFKPGRKSLNEYPVGYIRNNCGYQEIKLESGKWIMYHHYIWQQHYGPIPSGKIISFRDGNKLNVQISNLEMICQEENMLRNSKLNIPKEIIPSMVLINKINKQIKTISNG